MEMFCESAVTYARGVLPHEDSGELTAQQMQAFKEANILKKVYTLCMFTMCMEHLLVHIHTCTYYIYTCCCSLGNSPREQVAIACTLCSIL